MNYVKVSGLSKNNMPNFLHNNSSNPKNIHTENVSQTIHLLQQNNNINNVNSTFKHSIITKIASAYILIISLNILIIWTGSGVNQVRLISEKIILQTLQVSNETSYSLQKYLKHINLIDDVSLTLSNKANLKNISIQKLKNFREIINHNINAMNSQIDNLLIITSEGEMTALENITDELKSEHILKNTKAVYLRLTEDKTHLTEIISEEKAAFVYFPIFISPLKSASLVAQFSTSAIDDEKRNILKLGIFLFLLVFFMQVIFIAIVYKITILPIRKLSKGIKDLSDGDFNSANIKLPKSDDEFTQVTKFFNQMVLTVADKTKKIELSLSELNRQQQIMELELSMAQTLQNNILPKSLKEKNILSTSFYKPLFGISGDYYDFIKLGKGQHGIFICDVSGHGISAALITIMVRTYLREIIKKNKRPAAILDVLNKALLKENNSDNYLTACFLRIDSDKKLIYSNASHPPIIIYRKETHTLEYLDANSVLLGVFDDAPEYQEDEVQLNKGDKIILYTDGITESQNSKREMFGTETFYNVILSNSREESAIMTENIIRELDKFTDDQPCNDDKTLLIIEIK